MKQLLNDIRACQLCEGLPLGARPILQASASARILIAGQAPGRITHHKGRPFDDPSGDRLRVWIGVTCEQFYDASRIALVPMGFCYPGATKGGDLPPRPLCAETWRAPIMKQLKNVGLTLLIGQFAQNWHMPDKAANLTERVKSNNMEGPVIALPHPSPRNGIWLKKNPWFEKDLLPQLRRRVLQEMDLK